MIIMNNIEDLAAKLSTSTLSDDVLGDITNLLRNIDLESLSDFVSDHFDALSTLEHWAWQVLSEGTAQQTHLSTCLDLFNTLASFNSSLIFSADQLEPAKKFSLLAPQTTDISSGIFEHVEQCADDNDPYLDIVSLWLNNFSYYMYEDIQFLSSPIVIDMEYGVVQKFIMTEKYKLYLTQLADASLTSKQRFYLQTCSFSLSSYLVCRKQQLPFTGDEVLGFFADGYLELTEQLTRDVQTWSKELLSCLTQIINVIGACCCWYGDRKKCLEMLLPTKAASHLHMQSLIRVLDHEPFRQQIRAERSNDETILIDCILAFAVTVIEEYDLVCFLRAETKLIDVLLVLAETSQYNRISFYAYGILGKLLCEERLKELKIASSLCEYFFYMLEHAWNSPYHHFHRTSVPQLLQEFLNLAKNDSIQQKTADLNRVTLLISMCEQYVIVFDILWALSFNHDIQQQLRCNRELMLKLTHLKEELNNAQTRKITQGILWNLESMHDDSSSSDKENQIEFDIMISYSHKDKHLCKQIYDDLIKNGYRVWIDFDQMHGNVMDAMAQAIERSHAILICMSEQYRRSNFCRAEAQYAFRRQLKLVPVLLETHYRPDGWLLFLIGQLLYIDFNKHEFLRAMEMLFKELDAPALRNHHDVLIESPDSTVALVVSMPVSVAPTVPENILQWTEAEVQNWLVGNNLVQTSQLLADYNGRSLVYLNRYLTHGDPEQVLKLLRDDSLQRINRNLSLVELARLQALLDQQLLKSRSFGHREKNTHRLKLHCCRIM